MASLVGLLVFVAAVGLAWVSNTHAAAGGAIRGLASAMDIVEHLSPAHARRKGLHTRPSARITWFTPLREVGFEIGVTVGAIRRTVAATVEDVILYIAAPRTGKSGALARHVRNAVGAVLCTSTRPDLWHNSLWSRRLRPWWVFNPKGVGVKDGRGPVSTLRWSPTLAAEDVETAWLIAATHLDEAESGGRKDAGYWESNACRAFRLLLAAAHMGGVDMTVVYGWIGKLDNRDVLADPIAMLSTKRARKRFPGWAADLRAMSEMDPKPLSSIANTLLLAVQYMADRQLAHAATPGPDEHFTAAHFLASGGTLYVIGAHEKASPVGPLFSTFITFVYDYARRTAAASNGARLDPYLTLVLDEATSTFRTPLPRWTADAGGYGIVVIIAIQGRHQLREAFGDNGAAMIWQNATTKVVLGGQMDVDTLRDLSALGGDRADRVGSGHRRPVLEPADIKNLREFEAYVFHRNIRPVRVRARMAWDDRRPVVAEPLITTPGPSNVVVHMADHVADRRAA